MYIDKFNTFSEAQSVTATSTSSIIDLWPGYSGGDKPFIVVYANGYLGAGDVEVRLETSNDSEFVSPRTVASFPVSSDELLNGGEVVAVSLPRNVERYVRLRYVVSGGTITKLTLSGMLVLDI